LAAETWQNAARHWVERSSMTFTLPVQPEETMAGAGAVQVPT
jgi:hypothetical protein